ncbi:hypothetical protein CONCODRAFT_155097 [Conidiobolus coronatus NRRL 28638]|uniref:BCAS3 WD40 domain-containing protein n=1 Tax=Conidiobolus coronatus (strain ATCC 28846 / CBS 209.66 / NRRL 28638) TaxID=796925 RepID=A0A137PHG7_CONC2|nr:hypothetical protein CONCODRAFT_155097 [Conidiobolus coronatus NRRL 28638]|eukprot:KXN74422.1 hypothetical protein CONCODRAFT_155097 [Conidiobolus coronatus NRRL 28638]
MAKGVVNGLKSIGDYGYQQLSNYLNKNEHNDSQLRKNSPEPSFISDLDIPPIFNSNEEYQQKKKRNMGRVMIRDTLEFISGRYVYQSTYNETPSPIIAHFQCHYLPLAYLAFDESGSLLVTSSVEGHSFYIFEILGTFSQRQPYKLLYKLNRGITDAQVVNMKFNYDTRWLATTTKHGTTHLFSLNPYGGQPSTDAHLQGRVINKPSSCPLPNSSHIDSIRAVSLTSAAKLRQQDSAESDVEEPALESIIPNIDNSRKVFACHFPLKNSQLESWMAKAPQAMEKQSSNDHLPKSDFVFLTFNSDGILTLFKVITSGVVVKSNTYGHIQKRLTLSTKVEGFAEWNLSKYFYKTNLPYESKSLDSEVLLKNSSQNSQPESSWLPHVETQTFNLYTCPSRPLWTLSQFDFMLYSGSLNERNHLSTINFDNLEVKPLKIRKQDLPLPHGKSNISYQQSSSFSEIEDHIMKAMETDLEKPPTPTEHFSQPGNGMSSIPEY